MPDVELLKLYLLGTVFLPLAFYILRNSYIFHEICSIFLKLPTRPIRFAWLNGPWWWSDANFHLTVPKGIRSSSWCIRKADNAAILSCKDWWNSYCNWNAISIQEPLFYYTYSFLCDQWIMERATQSTKRKQGMQMEECSVKPILIGQWVFGSGKGTAIVNTSHPQRKKRTSSF
jgi:hypothetical protein